MLTTLYILLILGIGIPLYLGIGYGVARARVKWSWVIARRWHKHSYDSAVRDSAVSQFMTMIFLWPVYAPAAFACMLCIKMFGSQEGGLASHARKMVDRSRPDMYS